MIDEEALAEAIAMLDDLCTICAEPPTMHDMLGFPWCDEHRVRGEFLDYGATHNWPALQTDIYAVAQGAWFWTQIAMLDADECVLVLFVEAIGQEIEVAS